MTFPTLQPSGLLGPALLGLCRPAKDSGASMSPLPPMPLPRLATCQHRPKITSLLFDDSGSVLGSNDPIGNRYEEASLALGHLARRCRCGRELVSILHFDRGTSCDAGPCRLDRPGLRELRRGLAAPPEVPYGSSDLGPALADAEKLAIQFPNHWAVLVAFTDFQLFDPNVEEVLERFCRFPGLVHAVVLRSEPPARLMSDTGVVVTPIGWDSPRSAVARALLEGIATAKG